MKNLALAFCSIRPSQYPENVCDNREKEYLRSLKQLERVLPKSFDLLVCENTIDDESQIKDDELRDFLSDTEMCATGSESNIGTSNKGMGELLQLKSALDETDIDKYENVSYITARRFYTCPYVFERTESLKKGVPELFIEKFMVWHSKTRDIILKNTELICKSKYYHNNFEKIYAILNLLLTSYDVTLMDSEQTIAHLNGDLDEYIQKIDKFYSSSDYSSEENSYNENIKEI